MSTSFSVFRGIRSSLHSLAIDGALRRSAMPRKPVSSEAEKRGRELLLSALSRPQREQYGADGSFEAIGGETGTRYRIGRAPQLNVEELDPFGRPVRIWCFAPRSDLPVGDVLLAQKFAIELFEREALRIANEVTMWGSLFLWYPDS